MHSTGQIPYIVKCLKMDLKQKIILRGVYLIGLLGFNMAFKHLRSYRDGGFI